MPAQSKWKKYLLLGGILFIFPVSMLMLLGPGAEHHFMALPYYGPFEVHGADTVYHSIQDFELMDQDGNSFLLSSLEGKTWLAAFFSVSDSNLVKITKRLLYFTDRYIDEPDISVICFDTGGGKNDLSDLQEYIRQMPSYDGTEKKVKFLTGEPAVMDSMFRKSFLFEDPGHEEIFRLIDNDGHIRGKYGNTEYHMGDAISDAGMIKKEFDKKKANDRKEKK